MMASRSQPAIAPLPPMCCEICDWPIGAAEIYRNPDGSIPGLLKCSCCVEFDAEISTYNQRLEASL